MGGVRLPVFVYRNFKLDILKGNIQIKSPLKTGMIHIGYSRAGIVDTKYQRGILQMKGRMIFYGKASFSAGVKIGVTENATVIFGDNFSCNANTDIICNKEIIFGNDVILSWEDLIMDCDWHTIISDGLECDISSPIILGDHVWVGCKTVILKGANIPENSVIAAHSTITKNFSNTTNILLGGTNKVLRKNVYWHR